MANRVRERLQAYVTEMYVTVSGVSSEDDMVEMIQNNREEDDPETGCFIGGAGVCLCMGV